MISARVKNRKYFVSNSGTGNGLRADFPMSVEDFESNISSLAPWAKIYLKRGETFDIQISGLKSGQSLMGYGAGADPVIRGSDDISANTWTHDGSNIFYTTLASSPKTIFINGTEARKAETDYILITARANRTSVTASSTTLNALNATESLVGADFVCRLLGWHPSGRYIVTGYLNGVLSFSENVGTQTTNSGSPFPNAGLGFKLQNKKNFISEVNDWSYEASTQRLYIKTSGAAPENIRTCARDYGVKLTEDVINVTIDGIEFTQQYLEGVNSVNNNGLIVQNCDFHDIHLNAISARGDSKNVSLLDNTIDTMAGNGLDIGGITNSIVSRNDISNIGMQSWFCAEEYDYAFDYTVFPSNRILSLGLGIGIQLTYDPLSVKGIPNTVEVSYNNITNAGYQGIAFVGKSITVKKNIVDFCMNNWDDGGGIYCINRPFGTSEYDTRDCLIQNNIIKNIVGSSDAHLGTNDSGFLMVGIYVDNGTTNVTVDSNTIETTKNMCLLVNMDTANNIVTNNTLVGAGDDQVALFREYGAFLGYQGVNCVYKTCTGNTFTGNICVTRDPAVRPFGARSFDDPINTTYNPFNDGGASDNNHYVNPYSVNNIMLQNSTSYRLADWKTNMGVDANSTSYAAWLGYINAAQALIDVKVEINETDEAVEFSIPTGYTDVYGQPPTNPYTIQPYSSLVYLIEQP